MTINESIETVKYKNENDDYVEFSGISIISIIAVFFQTVVVIKK